MRRTTIYLDPELDVRLAAEAERLGLSVSELIRVAVRERLDRSPAPRPRSVHAGAFASGRSDTASDVDVALAESGFGE